MTVCFGEFWCVCMVCFYVFKDIVFDDIVFDVFDVF